MEYTKRCLNDFNVQCYCEGAAAEDRDGQLGRFGAAVRKSCAQRQFALQATTVGNTPTSHGGVHVVLKHSLYAQILTTIQVVHDLCIRYIRSSV
jgi:hypothetical protein